jgi:hypothetical protein
MNNFGNGKKQECHGNKFDRFEKWLRDNGAKFDQVLQMTHFYSL